MSIIDLVPNDVMDLAKGFYGTKKSFKNGRL